MARGSVGVTASGAGIADLSQRLRRAGEAGLRRELQAAIRRAGRILVVAGKASATSTLPRSGGLAARVAGADYRVHARIARNPGAVVTVKARDGKPIDLETLNRSGRARHPLYGNRRYWYITKAKRGWLTNAARAAQPEMRREIERAVQAIAQDITGR